MSGTTTAVVLAENKARLLCARHDAGALANNPRSGYSVKCGCGSPRCAGRQDRRAAQDVGAANPSAPVAVPQPVDPDAARKYLIEAFKKAHPGAPIPLHLAATQTATQPTDLVGAMKQLWQQLLGLRAATDEWAAAKGMRFVEVETDEADARRMFAAPTPWSTQDEAGPDQDGAARGDAGVVERRTERDLRLQIKTARIKARGAAFADKAAATAKVDALERELEDMLQARRVKKVERDFGTGAPSGGRPTGA